MLFKVCFILDPKLIISDLL